MGYRYHDHTGEVYCNNTYGEYTILEDLGNDFYDGNGKRIRKARIQFKNTGTIIDVWMDAAIHNHVRDPYARNTCGVGYYGFPQDYVPSRDKKENTLWTTTINKCYNPEFPGYKNNGALGIKICDEWLSFENFLRDIRMMDGHYDWKNQRMFSLTLIDGATVYSPTTCKFTRSSRSKYNSKEISYIGVFNTPNNTYRVRYYNKAVNPYGPVADAVFDNPHLAARYYNIYVEWFEGKPNINPNIPYPECNDSYEEVMAARKNPYQIYTLV